MLWLLSVRCHGSGGLRLVFKQFHGSTRPSLFWQMFLWFRRGCHLFLNFGMIAVVGQYRSRFSVMWFFHLLLLGCRGYLLKVFGCLLCFFICVPLFLGILLDCSRSFHFHLFMHYLCSGCQSFFWVYAV